MDGILVVNKPQGMTSHDVVNFMRRRFGLKKVGHAGTLDPMATGVLVILIGKYTKSSQALSASEKEYNATMTLGTRSDTGDAWGRLEDSGKRVHFSRSEITGVFEKFTGEIEQFPPMYSAVKVEGRRLYKLARKGIRVETKPRKILIKHLEVSDVSLPEISFRLTCSKGTYVRQLCVDMGEALGCGAHLSRLERTSSGSFHIDGAISLDELNKMDSGALEKRLLSL